MTNYSFVNQEKKNLELFIFGIVSHVYLPTSLLILIHVENFP